MAIRLGLLMGALVVLTACASEDRDLRLRTMRQTSTTYRFEIVPDVAPPHAREPILYRVVVRDRRTRQPIEQGEGRIFASNREGARTWDGLVYGPEIGTYYGRLSFVTAGEWAVALQFRRDSLYPLERIDWMQGVLDERPVEMITPTPIPNPTP